MAQKEWKREEMKQNQGRTEQNQRKKVQKKTGYRAVLAGFDVFDCCFGSPVSVQKITGG